MMAFDIVKHKKHMCFGLVMCASTAMNSIFVTYYLDFFMNVEKLDTWWFYSGQIVFMIWNALNDPLFGWISDNFSLPWEKKGRNLSPVKKRLSVIKYGGLLWTIAFVLVWMPPVKTSAWIAGIHFTFSLCFYDGMLTLVEVNHSALLAEISTSSSERAKLNAFSAVFAGIGSLSSFFGHASWDRSGRETLGTFRFMVVFVALVCAVIFYFASVGMEQSSSSSSSSRKSHMDPSCSTCGPGTSDVGSLNSNGKTMASSSIPDKKRNRNGVFQFITELGEQQNFWIFQGLYFIQAFDCTFEKNHFSIFLDGLTGSHYSSKVQGGLVSASFILPWINTVFMTPLVQSHGIYFVLGSILLARIGFCSSSLVLGPSVPWFSAGFLLTNRVMSEAICRLCPLVMTDLVDEDRYIHKRTKTVSATIIGASTLMGKVSQSLAPMFGYYMFGGQDSFAVMNQYYMLRLLIVVPLCCVLVQVVLWQFYSLRGSYLKDVKHFASRQMDVV